MKSPLQARGEADRPVTEAEGSSARLMTAQLCRGYLLSQEADPDQGSRFLVEFLHRTSRVPIQSFQF